MVPQRGTFNTAIGNLRRRGNTSSIMPSKAASIMTGKARRATPD
jgi:hypothetical protein